MFQWCADGLHDDSTNAQENCHLQYLEITASVIGAFCISINELNNLGEHCQALVQLMKVQVSLGELEVDLDQICKVEATSPKSSEVVRLFER